MRFILKGDEMAIAAADQVKPTNAFIDFFKERGKVDKYSEAAGSDPGWFWSWVGEHLGDMFTDLGHWIIFNLPDIMGYTTIAAGAFIILGAMFGKGGMVKPMGVWAGLIILAICILGGV